MIPRGKGVILYNSSVHAKRPTHFDPVYCMTKGGIKMLEREAALELAQHGIRVLCMEPGGVRLEAPKSGSVGPYLDRKYMTSTRHFRFRRPCRLGRGMEPYDVGKMAVLLASDDCELISGCEITMDGADMLL
jgi:glucose 1-dehydrogenase